MTALSLLVCASREDLHGTAGHATRRQQRLLIASLAAGLACGSPYASKAADPAPVKIAVFGFELDDKSAGGGVVAPDETDKEHLKEATEQASHMLEQSGRYRVINAGALDDGIVSAGGLRNCGGCEGALAQQLGADLSLAGIITRVTRTEYTVQIVVRDSRSGDLLANDFTGLRMGANYSWPRGVKWLMGKGILSVQNAR